MGTFSVVMEIGDPTGAVFTPIRGLVDTGSTLTTVPASLLHSLGVAVRRHGEFELADERIAEYPIGFAWIRYNGDSFVVPVVFGPEDASPIIGATTLETFGLAVDPVRGRLVPVRYLMR